MPQEGSVPGYPAPADIVKPAVVTDARSRFMYFSAVAFINDVKTGPFWEHSPMLFDISGIQTGWGKVNKGMIKMFNAEVLSKFPVVQHFPFGSLLSWDWDPEATAPPGTSVHVANQPSRAERTAIINSMSRTTPSAMPSGARPGFSGVSTAAPWAGSQAARPPNTSQHSSVPGITPPGARPAPPTRSAQPAAASVASTARPIPEGKTPGLARLPEAGESLRIPRGVPGTASNQHSFTKAPWVP